MDQSKYWYFSSDDDHDDVANCLIKLEKLELLMATTLYVGILHYGIREQDDGSLTIKGTIQYMTYWVDQNVVNDHLEDFHVTPLAEPDMGVFNCMVD